MVFHVVHGPVHTLMQPGFQPPGVFIQAFGPGNAAMVETQLADYAKAWREGAIPRPVLQAFWPMVRGTTVGTLFGAMPGTGPTITTFIAYALERRIE